MGGVKGRGRRGVDSRGREQGGKKKKTGRLRNDRDTMVLDKLVEE